MSTASVHQPDRCPNCQARLEVIRVKFRLAGAVAMSACPKCVIGSAELPTNPRPRRLEIARKLANPKQAARVILRMMETLNLRVRRVLMFVFAALVAAGLLRHAIHVYGGIDRAEIRLFALALLASVIFFMLALTLKSIRR
jgi:hypothetical protein